MSFFVIISFSLWPQLSLSLSLSLHFYNFLSFLCIFLIFSLLISNLCSLPLYLFYSFCHFIFPLSFPILFVIYFYSFWFSSNVFSCFVLSDSFLPLFILFSTLSCSSSSAYSFSHFSSCCLSPTCFFFCFFTDLSVFISYFIFSLCLAFFVFFCYILFYFRIPTLNHYLFASFILFKFILSHSPSQTIWYISLNFFSYSIISFYFLYFYLFCGIVSILIPFQAIALTSLLYILS